MRDPGIEKHAEKQDKFANNNIQPTRTIFLTKSNK
jgi:hypothetical protein